MMINDYSEVMASFSREFSYLQKCLDDKDYGAALDKLGMMKIKLADLEEWIVSEISKQ